MRLLSTLILTHCFNCVFPEDSDDEIKFKKLYVFKSTESFSKFNSDTSASNLMHKRMHDKQEGNFSFTPLISTQKCRTDDKKKSMPRYFLFNTKESRHRKFNELILRWHGKELSILSSCQHLSCHKISKNHHRKLLSYSDGTVYENSMKNEQSHEIKNQLRKTEEINPLKETNKDSDLWDNWGNWSTCSVTCGSGRQVRWRHCLAEDCVKGLKKAQIKTCHLKNCDSKTILHWLGIKP